MNTADEVRAYLAHIQDNSAIDPASLSAYAPLLALINATVLRASRDRLSWTDEPADFTRFLRENAR